MADIEGDEQRTLMLNSGGEDRQIFAIGQATIRGYLYGTRCGHNRQTPSDQ